MSITVRSLCISVLMCALFSLSVFPYVAHSESNATSTQGTLSDDADTGTDIQTVVKTTPYETEALLGDKVLGDFVLGPGKIELEIAPGETKTVMLSVSNRIGKRQTFDLEIEDISGLKDASRAVMLLGDDVGPYTLKDYISIPQMSFELDHNRRAKIPVTIHIPLDAEPGGHYGSVLVRTVAKEANDGQSESNPVPSSAIISRIGTLFFITIPGDINAGGTLKDFSTQHNKKWFQNGPIDFNILYENTGSIHLNPYGELRITNMFNEEVGFVELKPWFTLPQSVRLMEVSWDRELLYGRYVATIALNRGYDDIIDERSVSFWVVPWKVVLGAFVVLFTVFFMLRGFFSKFEFKRKET